MTWMTVRSGPLSVTTQKLMFRDGCAIEQCLMLICYRNQLQAHRRRIINISCDVAITTREKHFIGS